MSASAISLINHKCIYFRVVFNHKNCFQFDSLIVIVVLSSNLLNAHFSFKVLRN